MTAEIDNRSVRVVKLSKARITELLKLDAKGFKVIGAIVRFVVEWKGEKDTEETAVVLPSLLLKRN